jgi:hypothetical protein
MANSNVQAAKANAVEEYLRPNGNIVAVGVGTTNGTEKCVRIYVIKKEDHEDLIPTRQLISRNDRKKEIFLDVPAHVIEFGPFGRGRKTALKDPGTITRPGSPIRVKTEIDNIDVGARGTLGVVVTDGKADYVLSCNHILAMNGRVPSDPNAATIVSAEFAGTEVKIGHRDEYVEIYPGDTGNAVDCALARITSSTVDRSFPEDTVKLTSQELAKPKLGGIVSKVGAGTFFKQGRIVDEDVDLYVPYSFIDPALFQHQFMIENTERGQDGKPLEFATNGDSGALVVDESGRAVGMIFASSGTFAVACPIDKVMEALDKELAKLKDGVRAPLRLVVADGSTSAAGQRQYPK